MTQLTIGTLFAGGGGVDIGSMDAGLRPLWAVEYDAAIADVYRRNIGDHVTVADILTLDPLDFEPVDVLHASPPCPNFSNAKAGAQETENDIALGRKVAAFVEALCPSIFTLENVYGYRKAKSFRVIVKALRRLGYHVRWWHLNSADYGVAQTRRRLILVARQDREPRRPDATHRDPAKVVDGQLSLFGDALPPWVGWYAAIEDLIPTLPESQFAPWQLERLPEEMRDMLIGQNGSHDHHNEDYGELTRRSPDEPTLAVTGNHNMTGVRAFIVPAVNGDGTAHNRDEDSPVHTIQATAYKQPPRAFIVDDGNAKEGTVKSQEQPFATVRTMNSGGTPARAFILSNAATEWSDGVFDGDGPALSVTPQTSGRARAFVLSSHTVDGTDVAARDEGEPVTTVDGKANGQVKAFVVDHQNVSRDATTRNGDEPFITVQAEQMRRPSSTSTVFVYRDEYSEWDDDDLRDFVENSDDEDFEAWKWWITERNTDRPRYRAIGRVVQMTPRALARFQSFPDSYWLPDSKTLACRIIGNAVPPLLYQRVMEAQL